MQLTTYEHAEPFLSRTRAELEKQEVKNSLLLGIALNLRQYVERTAQQPYLATVEDETRLVAVAVMTPPHNLILSSDYPEEADGPSAISTSICLDR